MTGRRARFEFWVVALDDGGGEKKNQMKGFLLKKIITYNLATINHSFKNRSDD